MSKITCWFSLDLVDVFWFNRINKSSMATDKQTQITTERKNPKEYLMNDLFLLNLIRMT